MPLNKSGRTKAAPVTAMDRKDAAKAIRGAIYYAHNDLRLIKHDPTGTYRIEVAERLREVLIPILDSLPSQAEARRIKRYIEDGCEPGMTRDSLTGDPSRVVCIHTGANAGHVRVERARINPTASTSMKRRLLKLARLTEEDDAAAKLATR